MQDVRKYLVGEQSFTPLSELDEAQRIFVRHSRWLTVTECSGLFPVRQRLQFVEDFLQPLKSAFMIRCAGWLFAASQVLAVLFTDFGNLFSQVGDALCDGS